MQQQRNFQIKESPEGDWNRITRRQKQKVETFKLKNPRKGTETEKPYGRENASRSFQIKESPEGDWNEHCFAQESTPTFFFQIKESPEGDWNIIGRRRIKILKNTILSN